MGQGASFETPNEGAGGGQERMTYYYEPAYNYYYCREHGYYREAQCFPGTVGVNLTVDGKTHKFCPHCYLQLLRSECFELKPVLPTPEIKAMFDRPRSEDEF